MNKFYFNTRKTTEQLVENISAEVACLQSNYFASPAKWHLAHTTWFFEEVILKNFFLNIDNTIKDLTICLIHIMSL